jgi:hypothetical protein
VIDAHAIEVAGRQNSILAIAEAACERAKQIGDAVMRHESDAFIRRPQA